MKRLKIKMAFSLHLLFFFTFIAFSTFYIEKHITEIWDRGLEGVTEFLKTVPSMRSLEDSLRKGLKEDTGMENSCKQWFLKKVISFYIVSLST